MKLTIPTYLTIFRIFIVPAFFISFYAHEAMYAREITTILFFVASITDFADGYLARRFNQTSKFGAFLDPVADKILVVSALVLLVEHYSNIFITLPAIIIIIREIIISALREWILKIGITQGMEVSFLGKVKTTLQMFAIGGMLWRPNDIVEYLAFGLFYGATVMTLWSMIKYMQNVKNSFKD